MVRANVGGSATGTDDAEPKALNQAALEADLEVRIVRLEHLVAGLGLVLERLQGGSAVLGATVFDDFDDPDAGNEALDVLFKSSADARRDLSVLRRYVPTLVTAPYPGSEHPLVTRLGLLGKSASELAGRFEQHRRASGLTTSPRSPGGVVRLDQFVAMVVRALIEIAEVVDALQPNERPLGLAASAVTPPLESPAGPPEWRRTSGVALGIPVAVAAWQLVRRRRSRLIVESAGVGVVALALLVSALGGGGRTPGLVAGPGSGNVGPGQSGDAGVALGGGSPSGSPAPGASTGPGASGPPPAPGPSSPVPAPPPRATPRPTHVPAPTPKPVSAATRFNDRIVTATGSIDGLLGTITTAVQDADFPKAKGAADQIASIATRERSWLLSHPPTACYKPFYDSAFATYGELIVTAGAIANDADAGNGKVIHKEVASAHGDVSALRQAGTRAVAACP